MQRSGPARPLVGGVVDGVAEQWPCGVDPGGGPDPGHAVDHLDVPAAAAGAAGGGGGDLDVVAEAEQRLSHEPGAVPGEMAMCRDNGSWPLTCVVATWTRCC